MNRSAQVIRPAAAPPLLTSRRRSGAANRTLQYLAFSALLLTAAAEFGSDYWLPELLTHFRLQFLLAALGLFLMAIVWRRPVSAAAAILVGAIHAWPLLPYLLPGAINAQAGETSVRVMFANVQVSNDNYPAVLSLVSTESPDVVGFAEVDMRWVQALDSLHAEYPYSVLHPHPEAQGLALFSRWPVREMDASPYSQDGVPTAIVVHMEMPDTRVTLIVAHPRSPVTPGRASLRNVQLQKLSQMIQMERNREHILIGDLNITPWSPDYQTLEKEAKLLNAAAGRGYWPTWPTWTGGIGLLQIPIDQCLVSDGLRISDYRTGSAIGSDHLPIIVDIASPTRQLSTAVEADAG